LSVDRAPRDAFEVDLGLPRRADRYTSAGER